MPTLWWYSLFVFHVSQLSLALGTCADTFIENYAQNGFGNSHPPFWKSKVDDFMQCARVCVRRSSCKSITYDKSTRMCAMHSLTVNEAAQQTGGTLIYSEFSLWPSEIDSECFQRPCGQYEVCIPGNIMSSSPSCSYSCMPVSKPVCPLPAVLNGSRTVGSVNTVTCPPGYRGGGNATCREDRTWSETVTACTEVYNSACTGYAECSVIEGWCIEGRCKCASWATFDSNALMCVPSDCTSLAVDGLDGNGVADVAADGMAVTITCDNLFYSTAASPQPEILACTNYGWSPATSTVCYGCGDPPTVVGATLGGTDLDAHRTYTCDDNVVPDDLSISPNITCTEGNTAWTTHGFNCFSVGFRLAQGSNSNTGYLQVHQDEWHIVCRSSKWDTLATEVLCRELDPTWIYGGTLHYHYHTTNPIVTPSTEYLRFHEVECDGTESTLMECDGTDHFHDSNQGNVLAFTCFLQPIDDDVYLQPDQLTDINSVNKTVMEGRLIVRHEGLVGGICATDVTDKVIEVACKSINPSWKRNSFCKTKAAGCHNFGGVGVAIPSMADYVECDGTEPNIKMCINRGWNYSTSACDAHLVVKCKL